MKTIFPSIHPLRVLSFAIAFASLVFANAALAALGPDDLLLIVNKNVPEGLELASQYAKARGVPEGRIVSLDLPVGEEMPFDTFERDVVPPLRAYLREHSDSHDQKLSDRVKCLVTFYGVPLKVAQRLSTPEVLAERASIEKELHDLAGVVEQSVGELEKMAIAEEPGFKPMSAPAIGTVQPEQGLDFLLRRADYAAGHVLVALQRGGAGADPRHRAATLAKLNELTRVLSQPLQAPTTAPSTGPAVGPLPPLTPADVADSNGKPAVAPSAAPAFRPAAATKPASQAEIVALQERRFDPQARGRLREVARNAGIVSQVRVLDAQLEFLSPSPEDAAPDSTDNELALLWWPGYPRTGWRVNPLWVRVNEFRGPPVLMVSRLDAPTPAIVRDMIDTSIRVEAAGLDGRVVIDAQGIQPTDKEGRPDAKGIFDQDIRDAHKLLREKTKLAIAFDDNPPVFPRDSFSDVALYYGWYSLQNYVPSMKFRPGAVAMHIASFEMTTLRGPGTHEWCANLLRDGAVATFGPVGEPYLHSFPKSSEFCPLLLCGKLTLAEVFWRTNPLVSWKICLIGDPLYMPYKVNPPMRVEDLPDALMRAFPGVNMPARPDDRGMPPVAPTAP